MQMIKTDLVPTSIAKTTKDSKADDTMHLDAQLILEWKGKDGKSKPETIGFPLDCKLGISDGGNGNDNFHFRGIGPRDVSFDGKFYKVYLSGNLTVPDLFGHTKPKGD